MELALTIMMVLGIFVAAPALIGLAIAGVYIQCDRRTRRAKAVGQQKTMKNTKTVKVAEPTKSK